MSGLPRSAPAVDHPLVGAWRLRSWVAIGDDGSETRPMGDAPDGLLTYSGDGTMIGIMGPAGRPRFTDDDVTGGTDEERARAFATFVAYGGRFTIDGETVSHHVETSLFPNWIGTVQRRHWALDDEARHLTLTSPPLVLGGATRIQRLSWERQRD
ncbi:MAG: lipocalin-like domain-containing protein [Candidatus Limnocylindrales bacterium]